MAETKQQLTPQMVQDYIAVKGVRCPFCLSYAIKAGQVETDEDWASCRVRCRTCKAAWRNNYALTSVSAYAADGGHPDPVLPGVTPPGRPSDTQPPRLCQHGARWYIRRFVATLGTLVFRPDDGTFGLEGSDAVRPGRVATALGPLLLAWFRACPNQYLIVSQLETVGYDPDNFPQPPQKKTGTQ